MAEERILMVCPDLPDDQEPADVSRDQFGRVWKPRGWVEYTPPAEVDVDQTVDDVLAEVDGDPGRAALALAAEKAGKDRKSLIEALTRLAAPDTTEKE